MRSGRYTVHAQQGTFARVERRGHDEPDAVFLRPDLVSPFQRSFEDERHASGLVDRLPLPASFLPQARRRFGMRVEGVPHRGPEAVGLGLLALHHEHPCAGHRGRPALEEEEEAVHVVDGESHRCHYACAPEMQLKAYRWRRGVRLEGLGDLARDAPIGNRPLAERQREVFAAEGFAIADVDSPAEIRDREFLVFVDNLYVSPALLRTFLKARRREAPRTPCVQLAVADGPFTAFSQFAGEQPPVAAGSRRGYRY